VLAVLEDVGHYGEDVVEFAHVVHEQGEYLLPVVA